MQILKTMKKGLAIVLTLAIAFSTFAIAASATSVSSDYDSELAAMMSDNYDKSLRFGSGDIGLENYDIVSQGKDWANAYWNTRYNYIQFSSGNPVEVTSKVGYTAPGFTLKWEVFTTTAESGTSEMSFGDLRFITNYGEKALYLMLGESELGRLDTGCTDATDFADKYCYNEYTITYIDGVITVTRLITAKGETTASNTPITWTLPGGSTSTEIQMPVGVGFADAKVTWKSSSEIGKTAAGQIPAPFVSQYNGNFPTLSSVRLTRNIGFTTLQKYADFVDGLAANLNEGDVAKARAIYETIVANGSEGLVSEVAPLLALIEDAEQALAEGGGTGPEVHEHAYTSETTDATCTTAGKTVYTCKCGYTFEESIPATGHNYVNGVCSCGATITYVAEVNDVKYETLQAAHDAANAGDTITLIGNINNSLVVKKDITIDLNGYTMTNTADGGNLFELSEGNLIVKDSVGTGKCISNYPKDQYAPVLIWGSNKQKVATIYGGEWTIADINTNGGYAFAANMEIYGGTFICPTDTTYIKALFDTSSNGGKVNLYGGTFNADVSHQFWANEVYVPESKALKANGDGTWTVVDAAAYVIERATSTNSYDRKVGYATLAEAVAAGSCSPK